jgi:hypothetical protein
VKELEIDVKFDQKYFRGSSKEEDVPEFGYSVYDVISENHGVVLDYKLLQYNEDTPVFDAAVFTVNLQNMVSNLPNKIKSIFCIKPIFRNGIHTGKFEAVEVWKSK